MMEVFGAFINVSSMSKYQLLDIVPNFTSFSPYKLLGNESIFSLFLACLDNNTDQVEVIPEIGLEHKATANPTAVSRKGLYSTPGISYSCGQLGSCMLKFSQGA